jgi:hypothetical protein
MQKYNSEPKQIKTKGKKEEDEDKEREIFSSSLLAVQHKQTNPKVSTQLECPNQAISTHKI